MTRLYNALVSWLARHPRIRAAIAAISAVELVISVAAHLSRLFSSTVPAWVSAISFSPLWAVPIGSALITLAIIASHRAVLEIAFSQSPPHVIDLISEREYRFGVLNASDTSAKNVKVVLSGISPNLRLSREGFRGEFPYWTYRIGSAGREIGNCDINRRDQELYLILWGGLNKELDLVLQGFDTKNIDHYYAPQYQEEEWIFSYRVTAENAAPIDQSFVVANHLTFVTVRRLGEPDTSLVRGVDDQRIRS